MSDDFFHNLFSDDRRNDDGGEEPTFDIHDFKKWLSSQKNEGESFRESFEKNRKEKLRKKFHKRMKDKFKDGK